MMGGGKSLLGMEGMQAGMGREGLILHIVPVQ
jgi:hypothetical protein